MPRKLLYFVIASFVFHILLFSVFATNDFWFDHQSVRESALWSGGLGDGRVVQDAVLIDISNPNEFKTIADQNLMQTLPEAKPEQQEASEQKSVTSATKTQNANAKKKKQNAEKQKQSQDSAGSGTKSTSFGIGNSDTPAGGVGSGLDRFGPEETRKVLAKIRKQIMKNKTYPAAAKKENQEGVVKVAFRILPSGDLAFVKVIKSSGHALLDDSAVTTIKKSVPLPFFPKPISLDLEYRLR